jgi:peptidoglycan-N-acetylglucosamine deacetylase
MRFILAAIAVFLFTPHANAQKRIALSFDDVPRHQGAYMNPEERQTQLIGALKKAKVKQAVFFVNPGGLKGNDDGRIMAYARAGHVIANHSFTHPRLSKVQTSDYISDIDKAELWLKGRKGYRPWFRFPYLDEGQADKQKRDDLRAALKQRGLRNGYVTAEASDWHIDGLTIAARQRGEILSPSGVRDIYVGWHVDAANFYNDLAVKTLGRSPAHVILLHETDLAALYIGDLVGALRKDGWQIITADKAYADPLAKAMPDTPSAQGSLIEAMAWEKGLPAPRWYKYNDTELATKEFKDKTRMNVIKAAQPK